MTARARHLYDVGAKFDWSDLANSETGVVPLLAQIAAMLDEATRPVTKTARTKDLKPAPFAPANVFDALEEGCPEQLQLRPYDSRSFGRLGKTIQGMPDLTAADIDHLVAWIASGGLSYWKEKPTWNHVVKHFSNWVATARAWNEKMGGQALTNNDNWR